MTPDYVILLRINIIIVWLPISSGITRQSSQARTCVNMFRMGWCSSAPCCPSAGVWRWWPRPGQTGPAAPAGRRRAGGVSPLARRGRPLNNKNRNTQNLPPSLYLLLLSGFLFCRLSCQSLPAVIGWGRPSSIPR